MILAATIAALLAIAGVLQSILALLCVRRFAATPATEPRRMPAITVLKPLHGDEPLLEAALETFCVQDYPAFQIVFGVQSAADSALAVAERLRARHGTRLIDIVRDPTGHGANRKIGNLINMMRLARHDVIVIADSDLHVRPDYLRRLAAALERPGVGLVTTLYSALPANDGLWARLGALQITETFLAGAVLARAMGRRDCLGATMMLRRPLLERIGGLAALAPHLADDNVLGRLVRAHGRDVALALTIPATTVPEASLGALWRHELRWARTIRALVPFSFALSSVQHPVAWAALAAACHPAGWTGAALAVAVATRAATAAALAGTLRPLLGPLARRPALALLPFRDALSLAVMAASYLGRRVEWRGHAMLADTPAPIGTAPHEAEARVDPGLLDAEAIR